MIQLNEYLSTKINPVKVDKQNKDKLEKLMHEFEKKFDCPRGMWSTGMKLNYITKGAAEIFKDNIIQIWHPRNNNKDEYNENCFNCYGPANDIYRDVEGLMPFTKNPIRDANSAKTLFYGKDPIKNGNYLPFLSYIDEYYIKQNAEIIDGVPTFYLVRYHVNFM